MKISWPKGVPWSTKQAGEAHGCGSSACDQTIDHPIKLVEIAALFHQVAVWAVTIHLAVAKAPGITALRIKPDDFLGALADFTQAPVMRQIVIVARVTEHDHGRAFVHRANMIGNEIAERVAEIRVRVHVDDIALERDVECFLGIVVAEAFGHFTDIGDEDETAHARIESLQRIDELKHDALRTESDTSHRITTCGFSFLRFSKRSLNGTPPYSRFCRSVRLISKRPFLARLRRTVITFLSRCARRVTASFIFLSSSSVR